MSCVADAGILRPAHEADPERVGGVIPTSLEKQLYEALAGIEWVWADQGGMLRWCSECNATFSTWRGPVFEPKHTEVCKVGQVLATYKATIKAP